MEIRALNVLTLKFVSLAYLQQLVLLDEVMTWCQVFAIVVTGQMRLNFTHPQLKVFNSPVVSLSINGRHNQHLFLSCLTLQLPKLRLQLLDAVVNPVKPLINNTLNIVKTRTCNFKNTESLQCLCTLSHILPQIDFHEYSEFSNLQVTCSKLSYLIL